MHTIKELNNPENFDSKVHRRNDASYFIEYFDKGTTNLVRTVEVPRPNEISEFIENYHQETMKQINSHAERVMELVAELD